MSYNKLFQKVIFPLCELYSGTSIQKKLNFLNKSQHWSKKKIEEYQNKRLRGLINHAYTNVPYYKKLFDKLGLKPSDIKTKKDLKKLPYLTKDIVKKDTEELRAKNYKNKSFAKFTSGSTGTPTKFYRTKEGYSWEWAGHFRGWSWAGYKLGDKYVKISLNNDRYKLSKKVQDKLIRCSYIYAFQMNDEKIKNYLKQIRDSKPDIIHGYSSALNVFAEYMIRNNIQLTCKAIITTGDNLIPQFRENIEMAFGAKVFDDYGAGGEGLAIANQCEKGTYHIHEGLLIPEIIDNEIIITSLNNYAMPLIRYRLHDCVTEKSSYCKCGVKLKGLLRIDGRTQDVIRTPNGETLILHFFTALFEYIEGIDQFKVIQEDFNGIVIKIVRNSFYNIKKDEKKILDYIRKAVGPNFRIKIDYASKIPYGKSGKMRFIENMLK